MNKKDIQKRVLKNGKPLPLKSFSWYEETKTFSSVEDGLVFVFKGVDSCTFDTGSGCTFDTGSRCVIIRRDIFEIIQPTASTVTQICPRKVEGYLVDGKLNGVPHIIADSILSRVVSKKGDVYKVINHGSSEVSFLIKRGDVYSHGKTLKEAQESLIYKLKDQDTSAYGDYTLNTVLPYEDCITMYRTITGACEFGVRSFVESQPKVKNHYTIKEIVELTEGQYGHQKLVQFFDR